MYSFTEGFDKICSKLNCGTLKIKENGINIEKVFVVYQVHSGKISFTHDNYFVKIQSMRVVFGSTVRKLYFSCKY